jgi:hypothetical protein
MLSERLERPFRLHDQEPTADRAMLALQYVVAIVAVAAAGLLALVH